MLNSVHYSIFYEGLIFVYIVSVTDCLLLDLNFVVDSSGSINRADYEKQRQFMIGVVNEFTIGPDDVQVSLVLFSYVAGVQWGFSEYHDKNSLINAIRRLQYVGFSTNLNDALFLTHSEVYKPGNGAREGALKVTIILTDGVDNVPYYGTPLTLENAQQCKNDSIWLIAIGVSDGVDEERLKQITSPIDYYFVEDFDTLPIVVGDLKDQICGRDPGDFFLLHIHFYI